MPSISINSTSFSDFVSAFAVGSGEPSNGTYYAVPPWAERPRAGFKTYQELPISFPGVDGVALKRMGFRGLVLACTLIAVGGNESAVGTRIDAVRTLTAGLARYSIVMPEGTTFEGCKLVSGSGQVSGWATMGSKTCAMIDLAFMQYSEAN
jgi:hypothetical protein